MRLLVSLLCAGMLPACASDAASTETSTVTGTGTGTSTSTSTGSELPTSTGAGNTGASGVSTEAGDSSSGGPMQDEVRVGHARELRGVWVASVGNINFPSSQGLAVAEQQAELVATLDAAAAAGLNAVFFQVRPESDALYASAIEPWSRYLTGTQGEDPGHDPLAFALEQAHARGLELHAWFNPYRAKASAKSAAADNHISKLLPEYAYVYGNYLWMDPGAAPVQDQLIAVISDVVTRYDIDGVHFDDYFYPYPDGNDFPDGETYGAYVDGGGTLAVADWRRDNVNRMVERVGETVAMLRPAVRFGVSPFGIYRPGMPEGIQGLDQYEAIYSDPVKWMQEGWLDYLAPQLYWPSTQQAQAYGPLIEWWAGIATGGRHVFAGNYLSKLGSDDAWTIDEFVTQVELGRGFADQGSRGNIYFHVGPILDNQEGVADVLPAELYPGPVLTPAIAALADEVVAPPLVELLNNNNTAALSHEEPASLRAWVVYRAQGQGWALERLVPANEPAVALDAGTWAISAAARSGVESLGVRVTVP
ncbi:MAG: family 10 glycosylhydrolase [Nannocystis sp.]|nr:family 10 glycosylhydrolase [Nannocystis sp.]MBA3547525.1 family 10 glycosylhydrolase [Nannocystis sp.]